MEGISVLFVLISIISFSLESVERFRHPQLHNSTRSIRDKIMETDPIAVFRVIEMTCSTYFIFELVVRLVFCPNRRHFFKHFLNWIDICSLMPFYMCLLIENAIVRNGILSFYVNMLRLIRIFRVLRLTRHVNGIRILALTAIASANELMLLIIVILIGITIFACLIYYAQLVDETETNQFIDISVGFWWALVTITTLGYGDYVPDTILGCIVGAICSLCGVLMLALPVPVIVNNFTLYYAQAKLKLPKKTKRILVGAADAMKKMVSTEENQISNCKQRLHSGSSSKTRS